MTTDQTHYDVPRERNDRDSADDPTRHIDQDRDIIRTPRSWDEKPTPPPTRIN